MPGTILIAAGDANIVYLLQRYAEAAGFQAVEATPENDLVELAKQTMPVLIIVENSIPGPFDPSVLRRLKAATPIAEIPIVIYSCLDAQVSQPRDGVAGFLYRSVRYDDFITILKQAGIPV
jgi:CheY-like chemotaxis protein